MGKVLELAGRRFSRLTVESKNPIRSTNRHVLWNCICDCGVRTTVTASSLTSDHTTSCGCYQKEAVTTHGMKNEPEYNSWVSMIQRCTNKNATGYERYGGRGIIVCDKWLNSFIEFYLDMGEKPGPEYSVERKENDKGYEPGNCYWATRVEQQNNRRCNVLYDYKGQQYTIPQLARLPEALRNGVCEATLYSRINELNHSVDEALNTPIREAVTYIYNGVIKTITEWSEEYKINYGKLYNRLIRSGWDFYRAVTTP